MSQRILRRFLGSSLRTVWLLCLLPVSSSALGRGEAAPAFSAPLLDGGSVSLSDHRGKVVFLDFWASWCPPCLTSMPLLDALQAEFPGADFQVLAVNVDRDPDKAHRFLASHPVAYPSASDPAGRLPESYEIGTMPTSFLIDREGVIHHVHEGFRRGDLAGLRARIRALLESGR
jgi:peroxiredoxin